jgi:hypothetical protein
MRRYLIIAAIPVLAFCTITPSSGARNHSGVGIQDRYCLQGRQEGYPGNCEFSSYAQCMATASGTDSGCGINPYYAFSRWSRNRY